MAPHVHRWSATDPRCIVLIAHGYGEHAGRYEHVAQQLNSWVYTYVKPRVTFGDTRMRSVCAATTASSVHASRKRPW